MSTRKPYIRMTTAEFVEYRNDVLLSLDETRIRRLWAEVGNPPLVSGEGFWTAVHKAREAIQTLPDSARQESREWLHDHGHTTLEGD